jgi:Zn-dependent protease with chaperone function
LGALYAIFMLGRIPIKLVVIIVIIGFGMVWAVLKSIFTSPSSGSFGIPKTAADCPKLHAMLAEVAQKVGTVPMDEVYIAPGASIGVHQEGRGPFGMFGFKRRVLTLGLSTLHFLSTGELKSILAHEYAHFSHHDTFYSRFIYQVQRSVEEALAGMGEAGGRLNYVNPFFWFLYVYYRAYSMLAAGYSRSREFLADRMAATLFGADVFTAALSKVATEGQFFEATIYNHMQSLVNEGKSFKNMYETYRSFREEQLTAEERSELYQKLLQEKESLFASHPTYQERCEAIAGLPRAGSTDPSPAMQLFDSAEEIEQEMTEFLTAVLHIQHVQLSAAE